MCGSSISSCIKLSYGVFFVLVGPDTVLLAQLRSQTGLNNGDSVCVYLCLYIYLKNNQKDLVGHCPFILQSEGFGEKVSLPQDPTPLYFSQDTFLLV